MATRSIVTSHPEIACDVCGRRLLRGENPESFMAGGHLRIVCELCIPRATHEGWLRAADAQALSLRPARSRRGRTLLSRIRGLAEPRLRPGGEPLSPAHLAEASPEEGPALPWLEDHEPQAPSALEPFAAETAPAVTAGPAAVPAHRWQVAGVEEAPPSAASPTAARALEVFNASEHPRRIAGIARALGAPSVAVRPVGGSAEQIAIVVAWDLCWYRYVVDLGDEAAGATIAAEGVEVGELDEADRIANALADDHGELALVG